MDKKSKRQLNAQKSSAYYGARSIGTLAGEGMTEQTKIVFIKKKSLHKGFPTHPKIKSK